MSNHTCTWSLYICIWINHKILPRCRLAGRINCDSNDCMQWFSKIHVYPAVTSTFHKKKMNSEQNQHKYW